MMVVAAVLVLALAPLLGPAFIAPGVLLDATAVDSGIFWRIRLPRVITAFLAGAGLAVSGMAFQAMFRNPLATPFTLGVAGGASLGSAIYIRLGLALTFLGLSGITIAAFLGGLASLALVYGMTRVRGGFSSATLLLAGVAVNFSFSSLILFIQYVSGVQHSFQIVRWLMGSLNLTGYGAALNILPFTLIGAAILLVYRHELNLMLVGEDIAASRGVDVAAFKRIVFLAASLMVGAIVAFCGPIGFVGMMAPHICRLIIGPDHRFLSPATFLFGGVFLVLCDTVARTIIAPAQMPVGVITALLGGPFFIWLLLRRGTV